MRKLIIFIFILSIVIAITIGATKVPLSEVVNIIKGYESQRTFSILHYRLPRVVLSILAASAFSIAGVIMQCIIKNPLASPDILGVSNGGALAAMLALIFIKDFNLFYLPLFAIIGGVSIGVILYLITIGQLNSERKLALVGISLSSLCASLVQLLIVKYPLDAPTAMIWLTGSLWGSDWSQVRYLSFYLITLLPISYILFRKMDILQLGEELATGLGEDVKKLKMILLVLAILLTSVSVAYVGALGFVGLICPHITRRLFGSSHKSLIIFSPLIGASLLIIADTIGRSIMPPIEVPVGVITAFLGAPYLLYLMKAERS